MWKQQSYALSVALQNKFSWILETTNIYEAFLCMMIRYTPVLPFWRVKGWHLCKQITFPINMLLSGRKAPITERILTVITRLLIVFFCSCKKKKEGLSLSCVIGTFLVSVFVNFQRTRTDANTSCNAALTQHPVRFSLCAVSVTFIRLGGKQSHWQGHTCTATHSLRLKSVPRFVLDTQSTDS